ncbi:HAMP domain-containing protein [Massilia sp. PAMC28688]|uniref:sensor histidine kinase n=1 Tax=Massilia sp. PAMC28688 TaxID=2861283 RepID=UPI001C628EED|nr:ATP-binding protein [Massilia sp. PAMC28688]QYF94541.1 HAMP domain-containing protein [Massilia sp. PAMC28688]
MNQALRYSLIVGGAIVSILLFLLATASSNAGFFDQYYSWLLGLNASVAAALLVFVVVALARLYARYKSGKFGSRLMARLVLLFACIGILPGLVIFLVSVQFVSHSIDSWFNVKIEAALESGVNLGLAALDQSLGELGSSAEITAATLAGQDRASTQDILARLIDERDGIISAMIIGVDGKIIQSAAQDRRASLTPDLPTPPMLLQAVMPGGYARTEGADRDFKDGAGPPDDAAADPSPGLRQRVVLAIPEPPGAQPRFMQVIQAVPVNLATNAQVLSTAYTEYQERFLARVGLRRMYIETLTLTLLLAIFGAVASAFLIAGNLAQPLLVLAEGTRAVAEGDLSPRPIVATSDELGTLTQSFNAMTGQLFEARSSVERNRAALQSAKAHLESVLENMSAGVIVLDAEFKVVTSNEAVERILQHNVAGHIGQPLALIPGLDAFAGAVTKAFSTQSAQSAAGSSRQVRHWQQQLEIPRPLGSAEDHDITLLARGSRLPVRAGSGYIVVFDDISDVISAQRSIAWGEVARRLAHEIKNPLTPIQLSAERMQMKLEGRLDGPDRDLLNKGTTTIVNQVDAMKRMVDDFRDYAKAPPAVLQKLDLNALIEDILHMYLSGDENDIIHVRLAPNLPQVMGDPTQLRQVIHNLLQNAQDAMNDRGPGAPPARIDLTTEAIHYSSAGGSAGTAVRLAIVDNGPGFAPKILSRAFEPYVTSKVRGTGLGLPMVKKIIDEHGGRIEIQNRTDGTGASVLILLLKLCTDSVLA